MKNFENIFKDTFDGYTVSPSSRLWKSIRNRTKIKEFMQFNPLSFNIYYLSVLITAGGIISYNLFNKQNNIDLLISEQKSVQIENTDISKKIIEENKTKSLPENFVVNNSTEITKPNINKKNVVTKIKNSTATEILNTNENKNLNEINSGTIKQQKISSNVKTNLLTEPQQNNINSLIPVVEFFTSIKIGCTNQEIKFYNKSKKGVSFKWDFGNGKTSGEYSPVIKYSNSGIYNVCLEMKGEDSLIYNFCQKLNIKKNPVARFEVDELLSNFDNKTVYFINRSVNNLNNRWEFGDNLTSFDENPSHYYEKQDAYFVKLVVNDGYSCYDSTIFKINFLKAKYLVEFPNAFTPSTSGPREGSYSPGDNFSDIFYPKYKGIAEYKLYVYDRSGLVLFESGDINYGWNGYYKGKIVNPGVYIYESFGKYTNGETFRKNGTITVIYQK